MLEEKEATVVSSEAQNRHDIIMHVKKLILPRSET